MIVSNDMNKVKDIIHNNEYVAVLWTSKGCELCSKFKNESLLDINKAIPQLKVLNIDWNEFGMKYGIYFEPESTPTFYIFKNGERKFVGQGFATTDDILHVWNTIVNPIKR